MDFVRFIFTASVGDHLLCLLMLFHWGHASTEIMSTDATLLTCHRCFSELQRVQIKVDKNNCIMVRVCFQTPNKGNNSAGA